MFVARSPEILTMDPVKVGIVADCDQFSSNSFFLELNFNVHGVIIIIYYIRSWVRYFI